LSTERTPIPKFESPVALREAALRIVRDENKTREREAEDARIKRKGDRLEEGINELKNLVAAAFADISTEDETEFEVVVEEEGDGNNWPVIFGKLKVYDLEVVRRSGCLYLREYDEYCDRMHEPDVAVRDLPSLGQALARLNQGVRQCKTKYTEDVNEVEEEKVEHRDFVDLEREIERIVTEAGVARQKAEVDSVKIRTDLLLKSVEQVLRLDPRQLKGEMWNEVPMIWVGKYRVVRVGAFEDYDRLFQVVGQCPKCKAEVLSGTVSSVEKFAALTAEFEPDYDHRSKCPEREDKPERYEVSAEEFELLKALKALVTREAPPVW
jgi:hypothetical protein